MTSTGRKRTWADILWKVVTGALVLWSLYSAMGSFWPALGCHLRIAEFCSEASSRALDGKHGDDALEFAMRGCDLDDGMSCNNLGVCHHRGAGVVQDSVEARRRYEQACNMGTGLGCHNLGDMLAGGQGGPKDEAAAAASYRRACERDVVHGCRALIRRSTDPSSAIEPARRGCDLEDSPSCVSLALLLAATEPSSSQTRSAFGRLNTRCASEDGLSCAGLGLLYALGVGVELDTTQAKQLLKKSCGSGLERACSLVDRVDGLAEHPEFVPALARTLLDARGASK